jgi:hypothetical protein
VGLGVGLASGVPSHSFLEQLLRRVVFCGFLKSLDGCVALLVELLEVGVGVADAVVEVACERVADAVDTVCVRRRKTRYMNEQTYSTGPPATTVPSTMPQLLHPVTSVSINAARIYAKPAYSVHMTLARLDSWRCLSLTFAARPILPVSVFSVFSNEAASSLACLR